ncbi:hypothetical protein CFter6_3033 [Collimonas fungivorans]|uniref:Uncharacterized protein n=1 Tax=Collimonas fungivorans TaxID=158899 RepID=A0A127PD72_9BURK|nr:hypothetical protein CFter6_3033 [Collimonas fungivorans]
MQNIVTCFLPTYTDRDQSMRLNSTTVELPSADCSASAA